MSHYDCSRCGSTEFVIDEISHPDFTIEYEITCPNCGGYQGNMDVNVQPVMMAA